MGGVRYGLGGRGRLRGMDERDVRDTWSRRPIDDETRETAYQYWAFRADRNAARAARLLQADGVTIPADTIRSWVERHRWVARADIDAVQLAPAHRRQIIETLIYGGPESVGYLRGVVTGQEAPDKTRVAAAVAILDRIGFSPLGRQQAPTLETPTSHLPQIPDTTGLSPGEAALALERFERMYRDASAPAPVQERRMSQR